MKTREFRITFQGEDYLVYAPTKVLAIKKVKDALGGDPNAYAIRVGALTGDEWIKEQS